MQGAIRLSAVMLAFIAGMFHQEIGNVGIIISMFIAGALTRYGWAKEE